MRYTEEKAVTSKTKQTYVDGLNHIIEQRQKDAETIRDQYVKGVFADQETYRNDFKKMLGWPLADHQTDRLPDVSSQLLSQEDGYGIYRMQFEVLDGLKVSGLLFKADGEEKRPLVITQHGGLGTPELISGFYGSTNNYNDMLHRVIKHGVHAFAPQLLLWHEECNIKFDRKAMDARLKRVGSSITAVEVYAITRILDYFQTQDDVSSFGMVGLSYGGFYTLYTAAVDTRIKAAISCSFFNKRDANDWSD